MEIISLVLLVVAALAFFYFASRVINSGGAAQPSWLFTRWDNSTALGTAFFVALGIAAVFTFIVSFWPGLLIGALVYGYYAYRNYRAT